MFHEMSFDGSSQWQHCPWGALGSGSAAVSPTRLCYIEGEAERALLSSIRNIGVFCGREISFADSELLSALFSTCPFVIQVPSSGVLEK